MAAVPPRGGAGTGGAPLARAAGPSLRGGRPRARSGHLRLGHGRHALPRLPAQLLGPSRRQRVQPLPPRPPVACGVGGCGSGSLECNPGSRARRQAGAHRHGHEASLALRDSLLAPALCLWRRRLLLLKLRLSPSRGPRSPRRPCRRPRPRLLRRQLRWHCGRRFRRRLRRRRSSCGGRRSCCSCRRCCRFCCLRCCLSRCRCAWCRSTDRVWRRPRCFRACSGRLRVWLCVRPCRLVGLLFLRLEGRRVLRLLPRAASAILKNRRVQRTSRTPCNLVHRP
mmetsp:Transcript_17750/g.56215  ORF Transcript_17750/g.56215 Transcript_17750/m.56215 type:complete len:281 (+) Transcript_17750:459-1301(+)